MPSARAARRRRTRGGRHALLHARAVQPHRPDRAVRGRGGRGWRPPRRRGDAGPVSRGCRPRLRVSARARRRGRGRRTRGRGAASQRSVRHQRGRAAAVRHRQIAISLDGAIAEAPGHGPRSVAPRRSATRSGVRAEVAAIGISSRHADRPPSGADRTRRLARATAGAGRLRPRLRMSPAARLCDTLDRGPILLVTTRAACAADPSRARALAGRGVTVLPREDGALALAVADLLGYGVTTAARSGPALHAAAWTAGIVDRVRCYVRRGARPPAPGPCRRRSGSLPWDRRAPSRSATTS